MKNFYAGCSERGNLQNSKTYGKKYSRMDQVKFVEDRL